MCQLCQQGAKAMTLLGTKGALKATWKSGPKGTCRMRDFCILPLLDFKMAVPMCEWAAVRGR
jgi:hypothetical protein